LEVSLPKALINDLVSLEGISLDSTYTPMRGMAALATRTSKALGKRPRNFAGQL
jgi:hypothetical protein